MLAMLTAASGVAFTACGEDEPEKPVDEAWSTKYEVSVELSDDVYNTAEVTAYVAYPDGKVREEKVTSNRNWTLTGDQVPDKAGVFLTFVPKNNVDLTKEYELGFDCSISGASLQGSDKTIDYKKYSVDETSTVEGDKLTEFYPEASVALALRTDAKGLVSKAEASDFDLGLNGGFWKWVSGILVGHDDDK